MTDESEEPANRCWENVIKVLVAANSAVELAGLESVVRSAPALELVASCLGRGDVIRKLMTTDADVVLESLPLDTREDLGVDPEAVSPVRVWLVAESDFTAALEALQDSAVHGVLQRSASAAEIVAAIEAAARGLVVLDRALIDHLSDREAAPLEGPRGASESPAGQHLSPRESEILGLLAAGLGNKEIAWRLKISEHTVKFHVTSIFNKLGASSRAEAVAIGIRRGFISL